MSDIAFAHTLYVRLKPGHPSAVVFVLDGDGSQVTFGEDAQQVAREMRRAKLEMVQLDGQADSALTASVPPEKVGAPICRLAMRKAVSVCH